ncbi:Holliday junction DNA helicase RuvA [Lachnospiraceae bacterium TWA4]|nr:Holliday junction DNA helicase RuvA [Lachnospiraceae bacterium TWA4]
MISYIKGNLVQVQADSIILENGGIGYKIYVTTSWLERLIPPIEDLTVYTYLQVREDGMSLYGFQTQKERFVYDYLIGVNGVGPKAAMGILSVLDPDALSLAILMEDTKAITKAPGIGLKTAKKIILELKDKMKLEDVLVEEQKEVKVVQDVDSKVQLETLEAMKALGYSHSEALKAVKQISFTENMKVEDAIKLALKAVL